MKPTDFAYHLTTYLSRYLPGKAGTSRDTFSLLLRFCLEEISLAVEKVTLATLQKSLIDDFLTWFESELKSLKKACSVWIGFKHYPEKSNANRLLARQKRISRHSIFSA